MLKNLKNTYDLISKHFPNQKAEIDGLVEEKKEEYLKFAEPFINNAIKHMRQTAGTTSSVKESFISKISGETSSADLGKYHAKGRNQFYADLVRAKNVYEKIVKTIPKRLEKDVLDAYRDGYEQAEFEYLSEQSKRKNKWMVYAIIAGIGFVGGVYVRSIFISKK
ncbi:MAG: hypothetical protein FJ264_17145 [Planctomycetes bacterium]|nr:hypothetical protein [Planctomycetota bacterium]